MSATLLMVMPFLTGSILEADLGSKPAHTSPAAQRITLTKPNIAGDKIAVIDPALLVWSLEIMSAISASHKLVVTQKIASAVRRWNKPPPPDLAAARRSGLIAADAGHIGTPTEAATKNRSANFIETRPLSIPDAINNAGRKL